MVASDVIILRPHVEEGILVELATAAFDGLSSGSKLPTTIVQDLFWHWSKPLHGMHAPGLSLGTCIVLACTSFEAFMMVLQQLCKSLHLLQQSSCSREIDHWLVHHGVPNAAFVLIEIKA